MLFMFTWDDIVTGKTYLENEISKNQNCNLVVINKGNYLGTRTEEGDVVSMIAANWFKWLKNWFYEDFLRFFWFQHLWFDIAHNNKIVTF